VEAGVAPQGEMWQVNLDVASPLATTSDLKGAAGNVTNVATSRLAGEVDRGRGDVGR
jgi:hypothetical protein